VFDRAGIIAAAEPNVKAFADSGAIYVLKAAAAQS